MAKHTYIIGFMLFALFFGAGNLIYPPILGIEAGTSYWSAISGFVITGVGLPVLAVIAISFVKEDARELANKVHPMFGLIFTAIIYLAIGPFFGIPRAATVAYEMSVIPFVDTSSILLLIFTTIFFILVAIMSLNPSKVVDWIGRMLTPILLIAILGLIVGGFFMLDSPFSVPAENYTSAPFFTGFIEGYLTMDAIAALAFGIIVVNAFKDRGVTSQRELIISTSKAGLITAIALLIVYASLGWIGGKMSFLGNFTNGGEILSAAANYLFGGFGALLLGVIVALACFTTCVGLVVAAAQFFTKVTPLSYPVIVLIVTIGSFIISNQGLETIINVSVPVLGFIYPIAITLIILPFIHHLLPLSRGFYQGAILFVALVSLYDGLVEIGINVPFIASFMESLPFHELSLGWIVPGIIGGLLGALIGKLVNKGPISMTTK